MLTIPWLSPTNWYPGVAYTADIPSSTVYHENSVYVCVHSHYSGPVFEPGNWQVILTSGYAEAAQEAEENAQEYMTAAGESALAAAGSAEAAASSASVANFAMSQYSTTALVFATTSAGLAGTVVGRYFSVVSSDPDVFADLYLHSVGPVATFVKSYPSASGIAQILSDIADLQASGNVGTSDIADGAVTLAKMAARAEGTLVGRAAGAGSGTPQELTATQVRAILNVESGADVTDTANVTAAGALMESDVTSLSGVKTLVVPDDTTISSLGRSLVDDTTQAEMRTTLGLGALATKTVVATADIVDDAVTSDKIADGAIGGASLANGVVTNAKMADMVAATLKGRAQSSGTGAPVDLTVSQARVMLGVENVDNTSDANKPISVATGVALDLKVSTSELVAERVARDAADVSSDSRPGECLALWSSTMTGDPTSRVPMSLGTIVDGAEGRSLRLTGADADPGTGYVDVGPRAAFAVELDRVYRVRMVILRVTNPTDPEGHAVELRARNLGAAKSGVSDVTLAPSISPVVADGRVEVSVLVCRGTPPAGVTAYAPPGTARYITPFVRVYGNGHALDVIAVEWVDVTEIQESVSDLQSLESSLGDLALLGQVTNDEIADGAVYGDAIADSAVTNAKLAGMAEARIKGRAAGAGTGAPVDLDATQARALLSLTNVDNTSDANKPISSATAAALALLAPLASPSLTGTPTAPTASPGTNTTQVATTAFARAAVDLAVATLEAALTGLIEDEAETRAADDLAAAAALLAETSARLNASLLAQVRMETRAGGDPRDSLLGSVLLGLVARDGSSVGLDGEGRGHLTGLDLYESTGDPRDRISDYEMTIDTLTGMLMGFLPGGRLHVSGLRLDVPGDTGAGDPRDLIGPYIPILTATSNGDERMLLGLDSDGRLILPGVSAETTPVLRGHEDAVDVRAIETGQLIGTVATREGLACTVIQRTDLSTYPTAVALGMVETMLCEGQSNAGAGSGPAGPPPIVATDRPNHILKCNGSYGLYGTSDQTALLNGRVDLTSYTDPTSEGQSPMGMMLLALADLEARTHGNIIPRAGFTSWEGSQPISSFFPGATDHWNHENALAGMVALRRVAANYRGSRMGAMLFIQGENSSADYDVSLTDYIEDVLPLFGVALEQETPHFLFRQINTATNAGSFGTNAVALKQLTVARARHGLGATLTGPMYHAPLHDSIHAGNLGRMICAEADAVAWAATRRGVIWHPLWPVAGGVTRSGVTVTIPFERPPGVDHLRLDTDWVQTVANQGFVYADDDATGITVTAAALSGDSVVLTLSGDPGSATGQRVDYAIFNGAGDTGWAAGRGHLYADSGLASPFAARGFAVPSTIRHYCCRFRESIN